MSVRAEPSAIRRNLIPDDITGTCVCINRAEKLIFRAKGQFPDLRRRESKTLDAPGLLEATTIYCARMRQDASALPAARPLPIPS